MAVADRLSSELSLAQQFSRQIPPGADKILIPTFDERKMKFSLIG